VTRNVYTFSVRDRDEENVQLVEAIKQECDRTGHSFSHYVIEALKLQDKVDADEDS
jgi:hypothetical protein